MPAGGRRPWLGRKASSVLPSSSTGTQPLVDAASPSLKPYNLPPSRWAPLLAHLWLFAAVTMAGLWVFSSGFLLTRIQLNTTSACNDALTGSLPLSTKACWSPSPPFTRAVLLLVDALRFDFTAYNASLPPSETPHYLNKLPVLHNVLQGTRPGSGVLYKALADPPTTTLQRVKALTTGTLPTFIDAGSNFGAAVITEDNWLQQATTLKRHVVTVGDDVWVNVFPQSLPEAYPFPSFDVWDLHTLDNGVMGHLFPSLMERKDWDVVVAHFLGVDHAGHRYGPNHPAMADKLSQMNGVIERVFDAVDENTAVLVLGDHGMDMKGDHGGDTPMEVETSIFVYSKKRRFASPANVDAFLQAAGLDPMELKPEQGLYPSVPQIDFVPTLALLLGLPIPFGSLGSLLPHVFFEDGKEEDFLELARINAKQVHRYISEYGREFTDSTAVGANLTELFGKAESAYERLSKSTSSWLFGSKTADVAAAYGQYVKFMRAALAGARRIWARFDVPLIYLGSAVLILNCLCMFLTVACDAFVWWPLPLGALVGGAAGLASGLAFERFLEVLVASATVGGLLSLILCNLGGLRSFVSRIPYSLDVFVATLVFVMHLVSTGSDSFTIHEDNATVFLLQTLTLVSLVGAIGRKDSTAASCYVGMAVLVRLSKVITLCRQEQHPYCIPNFYSSPTTAIVPTWTVLAQYFVIPLVWVILKAWLELEEAFTGMAGFIWKYMIPSGWLVSAAYWTLDTIDAHYSDSAFGFIKLWLAKIGYVAILCTTCYLFYIDPICLGVRMGRTKAGNKAAIITGVTNSIGGSFAPVWGILTMGVLYVSKPTGALFVYACFLHGVFLLMAKPRLWPGLVMVYLMSYRYFFATGHQATLSAIDWSLGFVGIQNVNYYFSPAIIIASTYAASAVSGPLMVLLASWNQPIQVGAEAGFVRRIKSAILGRSLLSLCMLTSTVVAAGGFRRHLMVWSVWTPRFLYEVGRWLVGEVLAWISILALMRVIQIVRELLVTVDEVTSRRKAQ